MTVFDTAVLFLPTFFLQFSRRLQTAPGCSQKAGGPKWPHGTPHRPFILFRDCSYTESPGSPQVAARGVPKGDPGPPRELPRCPQELPPGFCWSFLAGIVGITGSRCPRVSHGGPGGSSRDAVQLVFLSRGPSALPASLTLWAPGPLEALIAADLQAP